MMQHKKILEIIDKIRKPKSIKLISKDRLFNGRNAKFKPLGKEFKLEFEYDVFSDERKNIKLGEYHKGIQIRFNKTNYNLDNYFLATHAPPMLSGTIDRMHTDGFSELDEYFYQLVIPLEQELNPRFYIDWCKFETDLGYVSSLSVIADINTDQVQVCFIHNSKKKHFMVISSGVSQTFETFNQKANAVQIALGYITGHYAANQGFFFAYTEVDMETPAHTRWSSFRDSIISGYNPITSNSHSRIRDHEIAKAYYPLLRKITLKEFSTLAEKLYNKLDFSTMIMLMLESSSASLILMPSGFAIALETISDLIIGDLNINIKPIEDKDIGNKIIGELIVLAESHSSDIRDLETITRKLKALNQPTNKSRLSAPFDILDIKLSEADIAVLNTRNDFLHGRAPKLKISEPVPSVDRLNRDLYYCGLRLYTLLNMLILKWIGYDNRVINYPKLIEGFTKYHLDEEYFRQV